MPAATLMSDATTALGLTAAAIAVGGFLMHAKPALEGRDEDDLRRWTVIGGLCGCFAAALLIVGSFIW